jgi:hypothetical protein
MASATALVLSISAAWMRRCLRAPAELHQAAVGQAAVGDAARDRGVHDRAGAGAEADVLVEFAQARQRAVEVEGRVVQRGAQSCSRARAARRPTASSVYSTTTW